jgi:hypothetical protein
MKEIGKVIAGICAFFFVLSGAGALLLFNIERKAFSSETYKQAFKEQGLYAQAPSLIANLMIESANEPGKATVLSTVLNKDELAFVISSLLPPAEIEAMTNGALDSTFAFISGETDSVVISLLPIKQNMAGEGGLRALTQILQTQPDCTMEQLLQMGAGLLSPNSGLMMCNPPQEVLQMVMPLIESQLQFMTSGIPNELTLITAGRADSSNFRVRLDRIRTVMKLTFLLPLFLLLALTLFAVRSLNDWLKWWGIPFFITGLLTILLALIGAPLIRFFMETAILQGNANTPIVLLDTMQSVSGSLARQILKPVAIQGLVLAVLGAGMVFGIAVSNMIFKSSKTGTISS